jgi:ribosomal protein S18 acetylase RimI-like enzyme
MLIREMTMDDCEAAYALWEASLTSVRDIDDSPEMIRRFLRRNPGLSVVAEEGDAVIGSILCGHDGRRGCLYHVAVDAAYRRGGVGRAMVRACLEALRAEGIQKCALVAYTQNEAGNAFWERLGFEARKDLYYRDCWLDAQAL